MRSGQRTELASARISLPCASLKREVATAFFAKPRDCSCASGCLLGTCRGPLSSAGLLGCRPLSSFLSRLLCSCLLSCGFGFLARRVKMLRGLRRRSRIFGFPAIQLLLTFGAEALLAA